MDTYKKEVSTVFLGHVYVLLQALLQALKYSWEAATQESEEFVSQLPATDSAETTVKDAYWK